MSKYHKTPSTVTNFRRKALFSKHVTRKTQENYLTRNKAQNCVKIDNCALKTFEMS